MARPERGAQVIAPYLSYDDAPAAIAFLCEALGFEEQYRLEMEDGRIGHAELTFAGNVLMLASSHPEMGFIGPAKLPALHSQLTLTVDDVDAHHARARAAGATIAAAPADQPHGERSYRLTDPEGHRWIVSQPVRAMTPEAIRTAYAGK